MNDVQQVRDQLLVERAKELGVPEPSDAEVEAGIRAEHRAKIHNLIAALVPITLEDLTQADKEFERVESRGGFYSLARGLVEKGLQLEGCILILATWNAGRFSKVHFDIEAFRNVLAKLHVEFSALDGYTLQTIQLESQRNRIEAVFDHLAKIKGVEYTGAPKVMHLMLPELFVPWDTYIRGASDKKDSLYADLPCVDSKKWCLVRYDANGRGYVDFLSDMQSRVRDLVYSASGKTLAKVLDEWNYVQVTLPIQTIENVERERGKKEKKAKKKARR